MEALVGSHNNTEYCLVTILFIESCAAIKYIIRPVLFSSNVLILKILNWFKNKLLKIFIIYDIVITNPSLLILYSLNIIKIFTRKLHTKLKFTLLLVIKGEERRYVWLKPNIFLVKAPLYKKSFLLFFWLIQ